MATPVKFDEANHVLGRPASMTADQCGSLHVWTDGKRCVSLWQLTLRERLSALFSGRVWLHVWYGRTQPPVAVEACRTIFRKEPLS